MDWSSVLFARDVNQSLSEFHRILLSVIDKVAPMKEIRVKSKPSPWMNSSILASIRKRDALFARFRKNRDDTALYKEYCQVRNAVQRDVKLAKESFYKRGIQQNKGNSGRLWTLLKSLGYSKKTSDSSLNIVLEEDGAKIHDPMRVAKTFNEFYTTVASNLVSKLPSPSGVFSVTCQSFRRFYSQKIGLRPSFVLSAVSSTFIRKQLCSLDPKKAVGLDGIASMFLRDAADHIVTPVTHIVNLSLMSETVPSSFKEAKVVPLYKKGSKLDPGNYRPVSILNVLSKILERAVHSQLNEYLEKRSILHDKQSGFRKGFSTDSCVIQLSDYLKHETSNGNYVGMVLIDLQKAFDTVDHDILIAKLRAIGVGSIDWFSSYLSDRSQCVEVNGVRSDFRSISCGVPQGSILGPQLFLLYINDLGISIDCHLSLYADDSALFFAHKDPSIIAHRLSVELTNCSKWLVDNKLSLHVGKTECLIFGTKRSLKKVESFQVFCGGNAVKRVHEVKYLGVFFDATLSGLTHVNHVLKSCAGRLAFLYRSSSFLDYQSRKTLCTSLIVPYLDYCCSSWYEGLSASLKSKLDVFQRKMVRFIHNFDCRHHVDRSNLSSLSWLAVRDRVSYFKLIHLFKIKHGLGPRYLRTNIVSVSDTHSYRTRGSISNFHMSKSLSNCPSAFAFSCVKDWNSLPDRIKTIDSLPTFKRELRKFLMSSYG